MRLTKKCGADSGVKADVYCKNGRVPQWIPYQNVVTAPGSPVDAAWTQTCEKAKSPLSDNYTTYNFCEIAAFLTERCQGKDDCHYVTSKGAIKRRQNKQHILINSAQ